MSWKVAFHTLGCKVNYYETEALKGQFQQEGFETVDFGEKADVYVFNTCTVTHQADRKSRQAIRRAKKKNPAALVAVTGCYPQVQPDEVSALEEADLILGTADRLQLPGLVKDSLSGKTISRKHISSAAKHLKFEEIPWKPQQGRTRAFLKIQDGCDRFCSYCVVPLARGPLRSLPPERALHYLQEISRAGYREVVLTGVHLGLYGVDLEPPLTLADLLEQTAGIALERIRLSSIEPADISSQLVQVISSDSRICPHLHVPLQSGDDQVLEAMKRPYDTLLFQYLLQYLRSEIEDLAVSTDIIVGFPGEEERNFQNSYKFVKKCGFSHLHVFKFSPRHGTPAAALKPQVSPRDKERRSKEMMALGEEMAQKYQEQFLGREMPVLLEAQVQQASWSGQSGKKGDQPTWAGLTPNYLRVHSPCSTAVRGEICQVKLENSFPGYILGRRGETPKQF